MPPPVYPELPTSLLVISGQGVPSYAQRGLRDGLEPIAAANVQRRTVNGTLNNLSPVIMRKFKGTVTGSDQEPPVWLWPGDIVTLDCVTELAYLTLSGTPEREVAGSRTSGFYTLYRPQLTVMVGALSVGRDEYGAQTSWSLPWEEV